MYVLFEEAGKFHVARLMLQADSSLQVELITGRRAKLKSGQVLLQFDRPEPQQFLQSANELAATMDVDLVWECAGEEEFAFTELAKEYYGEQVSVEEQAATMFCLFQAPHYFRRAGRGRFKKASAEVVQQALAAIAKKRQTEELIQTWAASLISGECPQGIANQLYKILFKPDKNSAEYKAVVEAARRSQTAPLALLKNAGAITSAYHFHWNRFVFEYFPKGIAFPPVQARDVADELPLAHVEAFSIDDSQTTEIDDAVSVRGLGTGIVTVGIHIAAPALAIEPGDAIDKLARERFSTVYMPGQKITMLPESVVQRFTLAQGQNCPALSLYVTLDEESMTVIRSESKIERVQIAHNLRHDQIDHLVSEDWLLTDAPESTADLIVDDLHQPLSFLYRLARQLKQAREVVRGKPETFSRPDYHFRVDCSSEGPIGEEPVHIGVRRRGAPLDLIVAECMILANSTWGQWLAQCKVPGIYRSQGSLAPGVKVRMGTKALPHAGIGVLSYAWSTSPLRRYVDLVNQWQLIACVRFGATAALAAPFKAKDAELFAVVSGFDAAHTAYNNFQSSMERYWTMKYVQQRGILEFTASVVKDGLVRAEDFPLVVSVAGLGGMTKGSRVRVRLGGMDFLMLEIVGTCVERLDSVVMTATSESEADEDEAMAGVHLALDVNEVNVEVSASLSP